MATIERLTDVAVRKATAKDGQRKLWDGGGLFLLVQPSGAKAWRHKYRFEGKEQLISLGTYPDVSLKDARERHQDARRQLARGINPSAQRRAQKSAREGAAANSFEVVTREWHEAKRSGWSADHATRTMRRMEKDVFPYIGTRPIATISPADLLRVIKKVEARGAIETAHTILQQCGQVFRYGIRTERCERDAAAGLHEALKPVIVKHMAAITEPREVAALLRAIGDYRGQPATRAALVLSALVFQRPGNVRAAEWAEIDLELGLWIVPSAKIKRTIQGKLSGRPHVIPLARQAVTLLIELKQLTGHHRYAFPSQLGNDRCMSENTINTALRRMGYSKDDMTAHGFRAMARTMLAERLNVEEGVIEAQLAHGKPGPLGASYDRAEYIEHRRHMMQIWADYLDSLRDGTPVVLRRAA